MSFKNSSPPFKADLLLLHEVDHLVQLEAIKGINIFSLNETYRETYEDRVMMFASDEIEIFKMFDIGRHIIAKRAGKGIVEYKEIAVALAQEGVITGDQSEKLILMAGYRNRFVHFYHEISDGGYLPS